MLKSKIGLVLAGLYLLLVLFTLADLASSKADAMAGLAPMFLTLPWSFLLAQNLPQDSLAWSGSGGFYLLLFVSAIPNAAILYVVGVVVSAVARALKGGAQR